MDTGDYCREDVVVPITTAINALDYNMCHPNRGICLILECEKFSRSSNVTRHLSKRTGSNVDREQLEMTFGKLGFHVVVRTDLNTSAVRAILRQVALVDHSNSDCFACIVLSHGEHGHIYSYDGRYAIDTLFNPFLGDACPSLVGKPKLFFIQACQGSRLDSGVNVSAQDSNDTASYFKIPSYADFMIAYSTIPGFYSFRNTEKGSWFIRSLVQVLQDYYQQTDLLSMMTIVCHHVAYQYQSNAAYPALSGKKQVPCITSMLTRRVFLTPKTIQL